VGLFIFLPEKNAPAKTTLFSGCSVLLVGKLCPGPGIQATFEQQNISFHQY
jgi:hypothetical protein